MNASQDTEADLLAIAKAMHFQVCNRRGFWNEEQIESYWQSCNQEKYLKDARERAAPMKG